MFAPGGVPYITPKMETVLRGSWIREGFVLSHAGLSCFHHGSIIFCSGDHSECTRDNLYEVFSPLPRFSSYQAASADPINLAEVRTPAL
jgi:hypothetical protein